LGRAQKNGVPSTKHGAESQRDEGDDDLESDRHSGIGTAF
jgi:hypothetical protein